MTSTSISQDKPSSLKVGFAKPKLLSIGSSSRQLLVASKDSARKDLNSLLKTNDSSDSTKRRQLFQKTGKGQRKFSSTFSALHLEKSKSGKLNIYDKNQHQRNTTKFKQKKSINFEVIKINNNNIGSIALDQQLSDFNAIGPIFEGMPNMNFSDKTMDWRFLSRDILSHYAPKIPFKYIREQETISEEQGVVLKKERELKKRLSLKSLKQLKVNTVKHPAPVLQTKQIDPSIRFQIRRKSCVCTCCGGDIKNQSLKQKADMIDNDEAVSKELEVFYEFLKNCATYDQVLSTRKWSLHIEKYQKVISEKMSIKNFLVKDITRRVQQYQQKKASSDSLIQLDFSHMRKSYAPSIIVEPAESVPTKTFKQLFSQDDSASLLQSPLPKDKAKRWPSHKRASSKGSPSYQYNQQRINDFMFDSMSKQTRTKLDVLEQNIINEIEKKKIESEQGTEQYLVVPALSKNPSDDRKKSPSKLSPSKFLRKRTNSFTTKGFSMSPAKLKDPKSALLREKINDPFDEDFAKVQTQIVEEDLILKPQRSSMSGSDFQSKNKKNATLKLTNQMFKRPKISIVTSILPASSSIALSKCPTVEGKLVSKKLSGFSSAIDLKQSLQLNCILDYYPTSPFTRNKNNYHQTDKSLSNPYTQKLPSVMTTTTCSKLSKMKRKTTRDREIITSSNSTASLEQFVPNQMKVSKFSPDQRNYIKREDHRHSIKPILSPHAFINPREKHIDRILNTLQNSKSNSPLAKKESMPLPTHRSLHLRLVDTPYAQQK